jgi:hypothetical protein
MFLFGARGSVVGWGTMLLAGRSRDRVPMRWMFFNLPNPSSRNLALGSIQPLTEMSTRNLPGGKRRPARKYDNVTAIGEPIVQKMLEPQPLTTLRAFTACCRDRFTFFNFCIFFQTVWYVKPQIIKKMTPVLLFYSLLYNLSKFSREWDRWACITSMGNSSCICRTSC